MKSLGFLGAALAGAALCGLAQAAGAPCPTGQYTLVPRVRGGDLHAPHLRDANDNSSNWAGFAAESSLSDPGFEVVTMATGTWTVPTVTGSQGKTDYSAAWVGIDGYYDSQLEAALKGLSAEDKRDIILALQTVEQIGTEQDWTAQGPEYYAWYELYPQGSFEIRGFPVKPGDSITATVSYVGNGQFQLQLVNSTENATYSKTVSFDADRYSAEWIVEAPASYGGVMALADFGTVTFSNCGLTLSGTTETVGSAASQAINMVESNGTAEATASALNAAGTGFSVTWQSSGATSNRNGPEPGQIF